jgi:hypothetical protein
MAEQKKILPFLAGGIPILNQPKLEVTISVDLATGKLLPITITGPDINFIALCDLLATQQQAILREALLRAPAAGGIPGGKTGGNPDGKPEGNPA